MEKIDGSSRIGQILPASRTQPIKAEKYIPQQAAPATIKSIKSAAENWSLLQLKIKRALSNTRNMERQGLEILIKEIMVWEYGDQFALDNGFNEAALKIESAVRSNGAVLEKLQRLMRQLSE